MYKYKQLKRYHAGLRQELPKVYFNRGSSQGRWLHRSPSPNSKAVLEAGAVRGHRHVRLVPLRHTPLPPRADPDNGSGEDKKEGSLVRLYSTEQIQHSRVKPGQVRQGLPLPPYEEEVGRCGRSATYPTVSHEATNPSLPSRGTIT
jgi:hypothetical protein